LKAGTAFIIAADKLTVCAAIAAGSVFPFTAITDYAWYYMRHPLRRKLTKVRRQTAWLATRISFYDEKNCQPGERLGADIEAVAPRYFGSDPRIGYHFIYPACGYGRVPASPKTCRL